MHYYELVENRLTSIGHKNYGAAWEQIKEECSDAVNHGFKTDNWLFRGTDSKKYTIGIYSGNYKPRSPAHAQYNYYKIIENLPSWKDWPKRSRSIVGASGIGLISRASEYGINKYFIFPVNGSTVCFCPANDFWDSFKKKIDDLDEFISKLMTVIQKQGFNFSRNWTEDKIYNKFEYILNNLDKDEVPSFLAEINQLLKYENRYERLNQLLSPVNNNFKMCSTNNLPAGKQVEWWCADKCYAIEVVWFIENIGRKPKKK